jgi:hypothetical protein
VSVNNGGNCSTADNRLQTGPFQFWSDCNSVTFCTEQGICSPKRCRKDEFPFGYAQGAAFPPKSPQGQFCPDEGSDCQVLLTVRSPCQLNRDGITLIFCPDEGSDCLVLLTVRSPCQLNRDGITLIFCPDEGSDCQVLLTVRSPCQLNRDGITLIFSFV